MPVFEIQKISLVQMDSQITAEAILSYREYPMIIKNSRELSDLAGQFSKDMSFEDPYSYLHLFIAVSIGGKIGKRIGTHSKISYNLIQKITGILTFLISVRLFIKIISLK